MGNVVHDHRVTWAHAVRDVICKALDRGQLPLLSVMLVFVMMFYRLPIDEAVDVFKRFMADLENFQICGWLLAGFVIFGWYRHARYQREQFDRDYARLDKEKSEMQNKLTGRQGQGNQTRK
ncbi:MAG TPA: hypothetical protein VGH80_14300 [Xanthomonadaceae bacterium]|jgi:hypothetical protein